MGEEKQAVYELYCNRSIDNPEGRITLLLLKSLTAVLDEMELDLLNPWGCDSCHVRGRRHQVSGTLGFKCSSEFIYTIFARGYFCSETCYFNWLKLELKKICPGLTPEEINFDLYG